MESSNRAAAVSLSIIPLIRNIAICVTHLSNVPKDSMCTAALS